MNRKTSLRFRFSISLFKHAMIKIESNARTYAQSRTLLAYYASREGQDKIKKRTKR